MLLLWLDEYHPEIASEDAKRVLEESFLQSQGNTNAEKHRIKAVTEKALELVARADSEQSFPIIFSNMNSKLFVEFLHYRAKLRGKEYMSKSSCEEFRAAFRELHRQCKVTMSSTLEEKLKIKFKGLLRGHAEEKQKTGGRIAEGKDPMSFPLYKFLCKKWHKTEGRMQYFPTFS